MQEIWKDILGYEGYYQISNMGRVKSLKFNKEKILKPGKYNRDRKYLFVTLSNNGIKKGYKVHRLVAQVFIPNLKDEKEVNHINGIKSDNRVENLEWINCKDNILYSYRNLDRQPNYKKVSQYSLNGVFIKSWKSVSEASKETNINIASISRCCTNKIRMAGKYLWKFNN